MSGNPSISPPIPEEGQRLEALADTVLRRVQSAFAEIIEAVPAPTDRPHEIEKALGLHKTLAWKLAKIVESDDPVAIYPRIPGHGAVDKFLTAARRQGVGNGLLGEMRSALEELDGLVVRHASDRDTFEMIMAGLTEQPHVDTELAYRKDGFRATSHIWGVQARTILRSVLWYPAAGDDATLDAAVIFGCVDLRRLRADRPWVVQRWRPTDDHGRPIPVAREPIEAVDDGGAPLLAAFGSTPAPEVRRVKLDDGTTEDEVLAGPVGNAGAVSFFMSEVVRSVASRHRNPVDEIIAQNLELRTPCQTVVFDHLVHRELFGRVEPRVRVYGELAGRPLYTTLRANRDRLDVFERVEYLGTGPDVGSTPEVPRYEDVVGHVCARLGWDADALDVYRLRMLFPYVPATLTYAYPLPNAPSSPSTSPPTSPATAR